MSTFKTPIGRASVVAMPQDFVSTDTAALASHMNHCASNRSRFFSFHAAVELAQSVVFSRMVTAAVLAAVMLAIVGFV